MTIKYKLKFQSNYLCGFDNKIVELDESKSGKSKYCRDYIERKVSEFLRGSKEKADVAFWSPLRNETR